ncbi:hypothetical protein SDC9_174471 [bioreactor metagenome]|uniref:Uncharacterized protein n=1 Tax=bioreactor metagenome TaxID=1076179 RepID=A0A645GSR0_9ZZZZ
MRNDNRLCGGHHENAHPNADNKGQPVQGCAEGVYPAHAPGSDFPAHQNGGGVCQGEHHHGIDPVYVACYVIGRKNFGGLGHITHHRGKQGGAQPPEGLVAHHGKAVPPKAARHGHAGAQQKSGAQRIAPAEGGAQEHDDEFQNPG